MVEEFLLFIAIFIKCALCRIQLEIRHFERVTMDNSLFWSVELKKVLASNRMVDYN